MAEAPCLSMAGRRLENLAREITCTICNSHYKNPRVLPCCHYYCHDCLSGLLTDGNITCPNCKVVATGCGSLDQLPPAIVVSHLQMLHSWMARLEEVDVLCDMCSDIKAVAFCKECEDYICSDCLKYHQKMKIKFHDHHTFSLEDLRNGAVLFPNKHPPPKLCSEHNEQFKLYCFDCCKLICRDCIVIDHAQHHYEFVTKSITNTRAALNTNLEPLKEMISNFTESAKQITEAKDNVTNQGVYIARYVHEKFMAMIDLLKRRELELLKKTETVITKKMVRLNQQEKDISKALSAVSTVMDYVNSHLDVVSAEELLIVQHQLYSRIEEVTKKFKCLKLPPVEIPNLAVKITAEEGLNSIINEKAHVYLFPRHKKSHVHTAEINKPTVQLVTDIKTAHHIQPSSIDAKLVSEVDNSEVKATVFKVGKGLYELTYTPKVRGRHKLHISANGQQISNSPFPVFVNIPPYQLGPKPIHIITGLKHPYAAIFDKDQNLLVTESNGTSVSLLLRNPQGELNDKLGQFVDLGSSNPSGIASDREGNVYITSASDHSIAKFNKEGTRLAIMESQGSNLGDLTHPCGLAIIDGEVYVCDRNNCRVQVFSKDLIPLRTFGCHGVEPGQLHWPYDLTQDYEGDVYITDCNNHRIQVFNKDGIFLRGFGAKMKRPMGVSLAKDGRHIFVSEYDNHRVSIYQTDGTFVRSFCHYGTDEGELCYPIGMAFDSNGFLYVCDQGNNRIQVF